MTVNISDSQCVNRTLNGVHNTPHNIIILDVYVIRSSKKSYIDMLSIVYKEKESLLSAFVSNLKISLTKHSSVHIHIVQSFHLYMICFLSKCLSMQKDIHNYLQFFCVCVAFFKKILMTLKF